MPEDLESRLTDEGQRDQRRAWNRKLSNLGPASRAAMTEEIHDMRRKNRKARQIITDLVEYAECNDPGNPHLGRAKGFLSGGGE